MSREWRYGFPIRRRRVAVALVTTVAMLLFLIPGCGDETTTAESTTTSESTTTIVLATTLPGEVWDLVYISDSSGWGVADEYAERIERDVGVEVQVHDLWVGGLDALTILESLRGETELNTYRQGPVDPMPLVVEAEVIVVYGNPERSPNPDRPFNNQCLGGDEENECVDPSGWDVSPENYDQYVADLVAIYDEIFAIRDGEPVILRTADYYLPWGPLELWRECEYEQICKQNWSNFSDAIHRAAEQRAVPVAGLLVAFSGEDLGQEMPREYLKDEVHPSPEGAAAIADVLADLGYEPLSP